MLSWHFLWDCASIDLGYVKGGINMQLGLKKEFKGTPQEADHAVRAALQAVGFGIITEIDFQKVVAEKLNTEIEPYTILGACNPRFANQALEYDKEAGLLLPCNVIVYQEHDHTFISAVDPVAMLGIIDHPDLKNLAVEVKALLEKAMATI